MNNAIDILTKLEIRPSYQRIAVMDYLLKNRNHATADAIFDNLSQSMPVLSRTTVYNTLRLLAEKGAIKALILEHDAVHFDASLHPHGHFICSKCKYIYDVDIPEDTWAEIERLAPEDTQEIQINYNGICRQCKN